MEHIKLGSLVKDTTSEWKGLVTGRFDFFNGSTRYNVSGADNNGLPVAYVFDEPQLEVINEDKCIPLPTPLGIVNLGDLARDKASGWEGVVIGLYYYLNGCVRLELTGKKGEKKAAVPYSYVLDEEQTELVQSKAAVKEAGPSRRGGSRDTTAVAR